METELLVPDFVDEVRDYCTENLAELIYRCVEHVIPRDKADWSAAVDWIERHGAFVKGFTEKFLLFSGYEEVRKGRPHMMEIARRESSIEPLKISIYTFDSSEVEIIEDRLEFLTNEEFLKLIDGIDDDQRLRYKAEFLSSDIWQLYQGMVRCNFFSFNGYGNVVIGI